MSVTFAGCFIYVAYKAYGNNNIIAIVVFVYRQISYETCESSSNAMEAETDKTNDQRYFDRWL